MNAPPYPEPYWDALTDCQKLNDLVHKIAQRRRCPYPEAYRIASGIIDGPGPGSYAVRLHRAGRLGEAIDALINYHKGTP